MPQRHCQTTYRESHAIASNAHAKPYMEARMRGQLLPPYGSLAQGPAYLTEPRADKYLATCFVKTLTANLLRNMQSYLASNTWRAKQMPTMRDGPP